MNKKLLFALVCAVGLTGCGSKSSLVYQTFKEAISAPPSYDISAADLENFPYSVIYGQLDDGPQAVIVLAYVKGDERQWLTAQKESMTTKYGRVVRTAGLQHDLAAITFDGVDPLSRPLAELSGSTATGRVDLLPSYQFGLKFESRFAVKEQQTVQLGPLSKQLTFVEETFSIPEIDYHVINKFWLDDHGLVWKSEQAPSPDLPVFRVTLLKPYSGDES